MKNDAPIYFILNKDEDFFAGHWHNIHIDDDGISIEDQTKGIGMFISDFYDSKEIKNVWHRLIISAQGEGTVKFTYYCEDNIDSLREYINNHGHVSCEDINRFMDPLKIKTVTNIDDILIHDAVGRYFWFKIEITNSSEKNKMIIDTIKIEFPIQSFLKYLPEVYQEDRESREFLEGYLGMFQSIYMDMESKINKISSYFDPDIVEKEFLDWLSSWVNIENSYIWEESKLRYLIKNSMKFYGKIGTVQGISDILELFTGEKPYIVEYFQIKDYMKEGHKKNVLTLLYGSNPYEFTVILSDESISSEEKYKEAFKLIEEFKPAHTEVRLVILKPYMILGSHVYLGVNSCLNSEEVLKFNGLNTIPFIRIE